jgi:hypothetical protein
MKKILSLALVISLVLAVPLSSYAEMGRSQKNSVPQEVLDLYSLQPSDVELVRPLYDADDTIATYCAILKEPGFIIYDTEDNFIQANIYDYPCFMDIAEKVYTTGAFSWYLKEGVDTFKEIRFGDEYSANDILAANEYRVAAVQSAAVLAASQRVDESEPEPLRTVTEDGFTRTNTRPSNWDHNVGGICMGTAAATLLNYYDRVVSGSTCPDRHMSTNGVGLTIRMAGRAYGRDSGNAAEGVRNALNNYFANVSTGAARNYTASCSQGSTGDVANYNRSVTNVNRERPTQIPLNGGGYGNHSVLAYGYRLNGSTRMVRIVDGWGNNRADINANIIYASIWITQ